MRFGTLLLGIVNASLDEARFDAPVNRVTKAVFHDIAKWIKTSKSGDWTSFNTQVFLREKPIDVSIDLQIVDGSGSIEPEGFSSHGKVNMLYTISTRQKPSDLLPVLKATLAHEFDHLLGPRGSWQAPSDTNLEYLIRPDEIDAVISQAYKEAKARKEPISKTLGRIVDDALGLDIEESGIDLQKLRYLAKSVLDQLGLRAKARFPAAIFEA